MSQTIYLCFGSTQCYGSNLQERRIPAAECNLFPCSSIWGVTDCWLGLIVRGSGGDPVNPWRNIRIKSCIRKKEAVCLSQSSCHTKAKSDGFRPRCIWKVAEENWNWSYLMHNTDIYIMFNFRVLYLDINQRPWKKLWCVWELW